jgi:hypothetical protein
VVRIGRPDIKISIEEAMTAFRQERAETAATDGGRHPAEADQVVVPLSRITVIDLEASGLGSASYPTEIGWALVNADGSIESGSCLIRPPAKWTTYGNAWSPVSERLTGITRGMLDRNGLSPREAIERFLDAVGDRDLFSDEPDFDTHWLMMLMDATGASLGERKLGDVKRLIGPMDWTVRVQRASPRHRAEADARRLALALSRLRP